MKISIDIIITTGCINNCDYLGEGVEIFIVQLFPTQRDWNEIKNYLFSLNKKKYIKRDYILISFYIFFRRYLFLLSILTLNYIDKINGIKRRKK